MNSFNARIRAAAGTFAGAAAVLAISPAHANSSANADIAAPLRAAQEAKPAATGTGDEQFRKLFSSWESLERSNVPALAAVGEAVQASGNGLGSGKLLPTAAPFSSIVGSIKPSIPSRNPLQMARLTSNYGGRRHPVLGGYRIHKGVDLAAPVGTPVHATADGVVATAEWFGGYGLYVALEHGGNLETRYGHMSRLNVAAGQRIHKGEIIGFVGSTGRSTGPHLHYEVRVAGQAVNPADYMEADTAADRMANSATIAAKLGR